MKFDTLGQGRACRTPRLSTYPLFLLTSFPFSFLSSFLPFFRTSEPPRGRLTSPLTLPWTHKGLFVFILQCCGAGEAKTHQNVINENNKIHRKGSPWHSFVAFLMLLGVLVAPRGEIREFFDCSGATSPGQPGQPSKPCQPGHPGQSEQPG